MPSPRRIRFEPCARLLGSGPQRVGTVLDLLEAIPYLLQPWRVLPPLPVVNAILEAGLQDAGMSGGCRGGRYGTPAVPAWVRTRDDWTIWLMRRFHGVPVGRHGCSIAGTGAPGRRWTRR